MITPILTFLYDHCFHYTKATYIALYLSGFLTLLTATVLSYNEFSISQKIDHSGALGTLTRTTEVESKPNGSKFSTVTEVHSIDTAVPENTTIEFMWFISIAFSMTFLWVFQHSFLATIASRHRFPLSDKSFYPQYYWRIISSNYRTLIKIGYYAIIMIPVALFAQFYDILWFDHHILNIPIWLIILYLLFLVLNVNSVLCVVLKRMVVSAEHQITGS